MATPATAEQITEWRRIIAFRNQLIHGYGVIKNEITWDIIEKRLSVLRSDTRKLLMLPEPISLTPPPKTD